MYVVFFGVAIALFVFPLVFWHRKDNYNTESIEEELFW